MSQYSIPKAFDADINDTNLAYNAPLIPLGNAVFSVSQLSNLLKKQVESQFSNVRLKAEISGLKIHTSGHAYFTLKDSEAIIDAVVWRGTKLEAPLKEGSEVIATGRITTYPARSKYQIVVTQVEHSGQGDLMKRLLENKEKFQAEGLFDHKRPLPKFPQRIGIVTSATGAVIRDILHRLKDRYPCHVLVWPVLVQGAGTVQQVAQAIKGFNELPEKPDIIIVARGGGSFEDLFAFNEEGIVRAVYESVIPVVSAIGHETDTTLIDYAADLRAPTPTAAAELITPDFAQLRASLIHLAKRLVHSYQSHIQRSMLRYRLAEQNLIDPIRYTQEKTQRLDDWAQRLEDVADRFMIVFGHQLSLVQNRLRPPSVMIDRHFEKLSALNARLVTSHTHMMERMHYNVDALAGRLNQSSYQKTLDKGFSLLMNKNQELIDDVHKIKEEEISVYMKNGHVQVKLTDVKIAL
ncbi:MAG: exodeoxyribonuclease VII large subunit [Alphaproteobacteria bacterium]|nr:exodeoxyribonuclease VII large subunit [Alphaproteobacteria bacterium]